MAIPGLYVRKKVDEKPVISGLYKSPDPVAEQSGSVPGLYKRSSNQDPAVPIPSGYDYEGKKTGLSRTDKYVDPVVNMAKAVGKGAISEVWKNTKESWPGQAVRAAYGTKIGKTLADPAIGVMSKALEVANAPSYAVANTFYQAIENKDYNFMKSAWDGLTLNEKKSFGDVLNSKFGVPDSTIGKLIQGGSGFILDTITDPVSMVGAGMVTKTGKIIKAGSSAEQLAKAQRSADIINRTKQVIDSPKTTLTVKNPLSSFLPDRFPKEVRIPESQIIVDPIAKGLATIGTLTKQGKLAPVFDSLIDLFSTTGRPSTVDPVMWDKFKRVVEDSAGAGNVVKEDSKEAAIRIKRSMVKNKLTEEDIANVSHNVEKGIPMKPDMHWEEAHKLASEESQKLSRIYESIPEKNRLPGEGYLPHINEIVKNKNQIGTPARVYSTKSPSDIERDVLKYTGRTPQENKLLERTDIKIDKFKNLSEKASDRIYDIEQDFQKLIEESSMAGEKNTGFEASLGKKVKRAENIENRFVKLLSKSGDPKEIELSKQRINIGYNNVRNSLLSKSNTMRMTGQNEPAVKILNEVSRNETRRKRFNKKILGLQEDAYNLSFRNEDYTVNLRSGEMFKDGKIAGKMNDDQIELIKKDELEYGKLSQASAKEINNDIGVKLFSTDPSKMIYIQGQRVGKQHAGNEFFQGVKKISETNQSVAKENGLFPVSAPELSGHFFPAAIAKRIDERYKDIISIGEEHAAGMGLIKTLGKGYQSATHEWKTLATIPNVAFHTTNAIGAVYQNAIQGVPPMSRAYKDGARIANAMASHTDVPEDLAKYYDEMKANNAINTGFFTGEIDKSIDNELMSGLDLLKRDKNVPKNLYDFLKKGGTDVGQRIETTVRSALYIKKRKEGYLPEDAARIVRDTHFDYQDLTKGERLIKNVIPFYTWNKKNLVFQIKKLFQDPSKLTRVTKLQNEINSQTGGDSYDQIVDKGGTTNPPIFIGEKDNKRKYLNLARFIPTMASNELFDPLTFAAKSMMPVAVNLFSLGTNVDIQKSIAFKKPSKVVEYPGQMGEYMGMEIPKKYEFMIKMIRPAMELERVSGTRLDTPKKAERWIQSIFGKNVKEYKNQDLMRWFDARNEEQADGLKRELNKTRKMLEIYPESRVEIERKYRKILEQYIKQTRNAMERKKSAYEGIRKNG